MLLYHDNSDHSSSPAMPRLLPRLCAFLFATLLCAHAFADTLTVAVAANVQYAFDELQKAFQRETGQGVRAIYGASGKFAAQIENGAPFDIFLSADMEFPQALYQHGATTGAPRIYAYGTLVLWTMQDIDLSKWQEALTAPTTQHIAVANPKTAPYGREAYRALTYYKLLDKLQPKIVVGESISQTNQYIHSRSADVGFTAKSIVLSPEMKGQGKWIDVPSESYQKIAQGAVMLKHGEATNAKLAQQFFDFLYSAKARAIFERYGYALP